MMSGILESLGSYLSPFGTNVGLKTVIERCLSARTKSEERWLFQDSLKLIKAKLTDPSTRLPVVTKCLLFASLAEMLGYKAEFAYIHALKLAQQGSLNEKKIGYLACSALLRSSDPLSILLVNTILRDLASKNIFEIAMAITASCQFFPDDQLSTLLPLLSEKLHHSNEYVRCKAVIAMHNFSCRSPQICLEYSDRVVSLLSDKDPGVVGYVIHYLVDNQVCLQSGDLTASLVNIQRQILSGKLPKEYTYHGMSAPWMQLSLIRLLGAFPSPEALTVIQETLATRNNLDQLISCAIACECFAVLLKHNAGHEIAKQAVKLAVHLLESSNSNLKLAGLQLFERLAETLDRSLLNILHEKDSILLPTLQHNDKTLQTATLHLLCVTSSSESARNVCSLVTAALNASSSERQIGTNEELVKMAVDLACKFPDKQNYWHLAVLIRLLPLTTGSLTTRVQTMIKEDLISGESEHLAVASKKVLRVLQEYCSCKQVSVCLIEMYMWALSHCSTSGTALPIIVQFGQKVLHKSIKEESSSKLLVSVVDAAMYALTQTTSSDQLTDETISALNTFTFELKKSSCCVGYLRDATSELCSTLKHLSQVQQSLPTSQEEFDFTLSFLDEYVASSLESGGQVYQPIGQLQSDITSTDLAVSESESRSWEDLDILSSLESWNPFSPQPSPMWTPEGRVVGCEPSDECNDVAPTPATGQVVLQSDVNSDVDEFDQLVLTIVQSKS